MAAGDTSSSKRPAFDRLGRLCIEGQEVATYLFQVPDDRTQWNRIGEILGAILRETAGSPRREMPRIAQQMQQVFLGGPSVTATEQLITGFDRLMALSLSANSGIF